MACRPRPFAAIGPPRASVSRRFARLRVLNETAMDTGATSTCGSSPRRTADPSASRYKKKRRPPKKEDNLVRDGHRRVMTSHRTRGTTWCVLVEVDTREKRLEGERFYSSLDLLIIGVADGHTHTHTQTTCRPSTMLLSRVLFFTLCRALAPLFICYLPQVCAQKPGSRVSSSPSVSLSPSMCLCVFIPVGLKRGMTE